MGGIRQCDGKVYCLKNFMVQEYQSIKYLTIAKEGSEIVLIDDLAVVVEEGDRDDELWVIDDVKVGLTSTRTNPACSALSHTPNISANVRRWNA